MKGNSYPFSSYEQVDDAEICVGQVHWHLDPDAYPDPGWNVRTTTCDQLFTGEATVAAYSAPEWPSGAFDGFIGVAAGVSKVPDQPGSYSLIAEPLDEAFRRGDSWRIVQDGWQLWNNELHGTYGKAFEVGGGVFLDEGWEVITEPILNLNEQTVYLKAELDSVEDLVNMTLSFIDEAGPVEEHTMQLERRGWKANGNGIYLGQIDLSQAPEPGVAKTGTIHKASGDLPVIEIETRRGFWGKIRALFGLERQEISVAFLESFWLEF